MTDEQRMERCTHEDTTEPLEAGASISACKECGKTLAVEVRGRVGAATLSRV